MPIPLAVRDAGPLMGPPLLPAFTTVTVPALAVAVDASYQADGEISAGVHPPLRFTAVPLNVVAVPDQPIPAALLR